jgi:hypothetical protein
MEMGKTGVDMERQAMCRGLPEIFLLAIGFMLLSMLGCGGSGGGSGGTLGGDSAAISIQVVFPEQQASLKQPDPSDVAPSLHSSPQTTLSTLLGHLKDFYKVRFAYAQVIPANVARLLLIVTGEDFSPIEANIDPVTGRVTVNVPVGNNRVFEVRTFAAASSAVNFIGRTTANVFPIGTSVTINMQAVNLRPPVAHAGPDQRVLFVGQTVQLDGSGSSDVDGDPLTFAWAFTSRPPGSQATLSDPTLVNPTFVADVLGTYTVQLIVNDGILDSQPNTAMITADNIRPVAHAGPDQTVLVGQTVQLDGSGSSDVDGDPLTFAWAFTSRPIGSQATLSDPTLVNPTFVADQPGTYVVQLIVNDGTVDSLPDTVTLAGESRPVAHAGPDQTVLVGQTVQLDGSGSSDVDGDPLTFAWAFTSQPANSQATLSNPAATNPTFVADVLGTYVVQLIVNDGTVDSLLPDTVTITASVPPTVDLLPVPTPPSSSFCTLDPNGALIVRVRNQGNADAPSSTIRVQFMPGGPDSLSTPAIPAGGFVDLPTPIPSNCFNPDCNFRITVDFGNQIVESNEGNNVANGLCPG